MSSLAHEHGKVWEKYIRRECKDLREAGLALVRKNWMAPKVPGERFRVAKSKPDFSGVLDGGRGVVFEAKATMSKTSWPLGDLQEHQARHLREAHGLGAFSFVYILDGERRKWVMPTPKLAEISSERGSVLFKAHTEHRKRKGETWLDTAKRLEAV